MTTKAPRAFLLKSVDHWVEKAERIAPQAYLANQPLNYQRVLYYNIQHELDRDPEEVLDMAEDLWVKWGPSESNPGMITWMNRATKSSHDFDEGVDPNDHTDIEVAEVKKPAQ